MPEQENDQAPLICILAVPESSSTVLYGLLEVLSTFGTAWTILTGDDQAPCRFDVKIVSPEKEGFTLWGGAPVLPHATPPDIEKADAVVVTDLAIDPDCDWREKWSTLTPWLRRMHDDGTLICSVCSGSVMLAGAGLLDGQVATTHWGYIDHFRRFFPSVKLEPNRILATAGAESDIVTTGGMASWEDLALYLIARFHGEGAAVNAAKLFVFGDRSEGQLLYAAKRKAKRHYDAVIQAIQDWIADHYKSDAAVTRMIERSGLPERTFKRRFKRATGYTPIEYVQALRIEEAKQLLETTDQAVDIVAEQVGYSDPTSFRRLFKRETGVTPGLYRRRYQAILRVKPA